MRMKVAALCAVAFPVHLPLRGWIGLILMATASASMLTATVAFYDMLDAVNAIRKIKSQIGFWEARYMSREIRSDYDAFYPNGPLLKRYRTRMIVGVAAFVGAIICFRTS